MLSDQQFDFFRTFPDFRPQQSAEPEHEFNRLAAARQWKIAGKKYRRYQREFQILEDIADSHGKMTTYTFHNLLMNEENSLERRLESLYLSSPHSVNNDACNGRYDLLEALGGVTLGAQSHNSDSSTALEGLQQLCVDLRCDLPAPPTITQCKKVRHLSIPTSNLQTDITSFCLGFS